MILSNYHTHTVNSDGNNTVDRMVERAVERGFTSLGFSNHSYTKHYEGGSIPPHCIPGYFEEIDAAKKKYGDKINVYKGTEWDYYTEDDGFDYEYRIGSVHYIEEDGVLYDVDISGGDLINSANKYYNGDIFRLTEIYFEHVADLFDRVDCDIVGHFDLVAKFNKNNSVFDANDPRYVNAWKKAVDRIMKHDGIVFEVNVSPVYRGYRDEPFPSVPMIEYIRDKGGRFIVTGDCHESGALGVWFEQAYALLDSLGAEYIDFEDIVKNKK